MRIARAAVRTNKPPADRDLKPDNMPRVVAATPCKDCPFRRDVLGGGRYLTAARADDIVKTLRQGVGFLCHETVKGPGRGKVPGSYGWDQRLQCAGAAVLIEKEGRTTLPMLLAKGLDLWMPPRDDRGVLVGSLDEFVEHHRK